jgi:hypothetical protein
MVHVMHTREGDIVPGEWVTPVEAIHRLHRAIEELRRMAAPIFDPSFGEQPMAILAPSEQEVVALKAGLL